MLDIEDESWMGYENDAEEAGRQGDQLEPLERLVEDKVTEDASPDGRREDERRCIAHADVAQRTVEAQDATGAENCAQYVDEQLVAAHNEGASLNENGYAAQEGHKDAPKAKRLDLFSETLLIRQQFNA